MDIALELALEALALDPSDYESHWRIGFVYLYGRQFDKALAEYEKARQLNPNHAGFLSEMAGCLILTGKPEQAISQIVRAMRINPHYPDWFEAHLAWGYYETGRYEDALHTLNRMNNPAAVYRPLFVATYVRLHRLDEAQAAARDLMTLDPEFNTRVIGFWPYQDLTRQERLQEDLKSAGIPG